jgi:hypothetical protein
VQGATAAQGFMGQAQGVPGETVRRLLEHACRLLCKLLNDVRAPACLSCRLVMMHRRERSYR